VPRNIQAPCLWRRGMPTIFLRLGIFQPAKWGIFNRRKLGNIQSALTPERWLGEAKDLPPGRKLIERFTPFPDAPCHVRSVEKNHSKPCRQYLATGGEIIRDLNEDPPLMKIAAEQLIRNVIHEDGGSLFHNSSENEQRSFDSTCRKFYRFLTQRRP
jgi:hypothetical protein